MTVSRVALDLLREAVARRWFLAFGVGIAIVLSLTAMGLQMDVVDGALAATRLFGAPLDLSIRSADVALRPAFRAATFLVFYGGLIFGIVACADFAPSLLSPGRIEYMLALPIRRWQLLAGTYAGVGLLAVLGSLYGAGGFTVILGLKTGVWNAGPLVAGLFSSVAFLAVYALMLLCVVWVRSAALSTVAGMVLLVAGIVAGHREALSHNFQEGVFRTLFLAVSAVLPRLSTLERRAGDVASAAEVVPGETLRLLAGIMVFGLALLCAATWLFERKDF